MGHRMMGAQEAPLCRPVREELEQADGRLMRFLPLLPAEERVEDSLAAFRAAPQFAQIDRLPRRNRQDQLHVLLIGPSPYYRRQAAVYLSTLAEEREEEPDGFEDDLDDFWDRELPALPAKLRQVGRLAVYDTAEWVAPPDKGGGGMVQVVLAAPPDQGESGSQEERLLLEGPITEELIDHLAARGGREIFLSAAEEEVLPGLVDRLRFEQGFAVCRVGTVDEDYLKRLFFHAAREQGVELSPEVEVGQVLSALRRFRGERFGEGDFALLMEDAARRCSGKSLDTEDLCLQPFRAGQGDGLKELEGLVGLTEVKKAVRRFLATRTLEHRRQAQGLATRTMSRNLAFAGPPGTCKSVVARLVAAILREQGAGTGAFVEAGREQLIGQYLGHTSPKVAELFRRAKGGVIFIDEAGALLSDGRDEYAVEAVNALVRHMELHPETMVIFATYPGEMEALLASNPGLSSRVSQVIQFPAYGEEELCAILDYLAAQAGYALPEEAHEIAADWFGQMRRRQGDQFGNGREARRLLQTAIGQLALRAAENENAPLDRLTAEDLRFAAEDLLSGARKEKRAIGF